MEFLHILLLAIVQGITEFLPISSSAHLILVPALTGWKDQGLAIDVAMHVGTLAAVMLYFRHDVRRLALGGMHVLGGQMTEDGRLCLQVIVATVPVVIAGFLLQTFIANDWRNPMLIAATTAGFGILLWAADRHGDMLTGTIRNLGWRDALVIGAVQALALVPGVSRSGITITAALFLGFKRPEAARFSLLLSIPTTAAAGVLAGVNLAESGNASLQADALTAGILAFASAFVAIAALMSWLRRASFTPFVVYRLCLSAVLLGLYMQGFLGTA